MKSFWKINLLHRRFAIVVAMESPELQKQVVLALKKRPQKLFLVLRTTAFVVRTCNGKHGHRPKDLNEFK